MPGRTFTAQEQSQGDVGARARIRAAEMAKRQLAEASTRRNLLGTGDCSNRNRTYNFPQGRVTDHRINLTLYRLDEVMEGKLDMLIQPIRAGIPGRSVGRTLCRA